MSEAIRFRLRTLAPAFVSELASGAAEKWRQGADNPPPTRRAAKAGASVRSLKAWLLLACFLLAATVFAADPIRYYKFPDGRIRLWLKNAPTVTATESGGWVIEPVGKEKDKTWIARLKALPATDPSPWKSLLEPIASGSDLAGVFAITPKATVRIAPKLDEDIAVDVSTPDGRTNHTDIGGGVADAKPVLDLLESATGSTTAEMRTAMGHYPGVSAGNFSPFSAFVKAAGQSNTAPLIIDTANGPAIVAIKTAPKPLPTTPDSTAAQEEPKPSNKPATEEPIPWLLIGFGVAVLFLGFGIGWATKRPQDPPAPQPVTPQRPPNPAAEQAWAKERHQTLKSLEDERAASRRYKAESEAVSTRFTQLQDDANRTKQELSYQIESLQRTGQAAKTETQQLIDRAQTYLALQRTASEAMTFLQAEIGRPEIAGAVGYLLAFSCANLNGAVVIAKPNLDKAMLANIERIAGQFPTSPHARKLLSEAKRLASSLTSDPIVESKQAHANARQFDEILRFLRNQRGLELSPFYFGIDDSGAAHAVYV